jgi:hypothetical protein
VRAHAPHQHARAGARAAWELLVAGPGPGGCPAETGLTRALLHFIDSGRRARLMRHSRTPAQAMLLLLVYARGGRSIQASPFREPGVSCRPSRRRLRHVRGSPTALDLGERPRCARGDLPDDDRRQSEQARARQSALPSHGTGDRQPRDFSGAHGPTLSSSRFPRASSTGTHADVVDFPDRVPWRGRPDTWRVA